MFDKVYLKILTTVWEVCSLADHTAIIAMTHVTRCCQPCTVGDGATGTVLHTVLAVTSVIIPENKEG